LAADGWVSGLPMLTVLGAVVQTAGDSRFALLQARIAPGLSLIKGGEGRGKTSLLRLIAATPGFTVCWSDPALPPEDQMCARDWLGMQASRFPAWDAACEQQAIEGFGLKEHLHKCLFMLSSGTVRKLALVAAHASQADCVLLDLPFAALDGRSRRWLAQRLERQAQDPQGSAWLVADYDWPDDMAGDLSDQMTDQMTGWVLATVIDLGD
jgi:ABC-type transport system involved in cytochrome c biogenesis ATPase subunit